MLVNNTRLINTPVYSVQTGAPIGFVSNPIVDPDSLKIIAFQLGGPLVNQSPASILDVTSIREYSDIGMIIDDIDELVAPDDIIKIQEVLALNFDLVNLKVKTRKGSKLGRIIDFTVTPEDFVIQQIIVQRPAIKALVDPELVISRKEIVEITDYEVIVKDEEKVLKSRAEKEDFIPNFVNPFREKQPGFAPADTEKPNEQ